MTSTPSDGNPSEQTTPHDVLSEHLNDSPDQQDPTSRRVHRILMEVTPAGAMVIQPVQTAEHPPAPVTSCSDNALSTRLRDRGEELTDAEAAILDTAQTIRAKFVTGQPVPLKALQRVTVRFTPHCPTNLEFVAVRAALIQRGLCEQVPGEVTQFRLVRHLGNLHKVSETRFSPLGVTGAQEQLLTCCVHCCSVGFENRQMVTRSAVKWLMRERHNMTSQQAERVIRELLRADILESLEDRGSTALRLTRAASLVVTRECDSLPEARRIAATRFQESQQQAAATQTPGRLHRALQNLTRVLRRRTA